MIKGSMHQEDTATQNVCLPNNRALKYGEQKLIELEGEIDKSAIIAGDFKSPLADMDSSRRQKISEDS